MKHEIFRGQGVGQECTLPSRTRELQPFILPIVIRAAVFTWCLCLFSTSWCAYAGTSKMSCNTAGKREASGFSAPSSPALATSFSKTLLPSLTTGHKLSLCGVSFNAAPMKLDFCGYSVQLFHLWSPFYHLWTVSKKKSKKTPSNQMEKKAQKTPTNPKQMQTPNPWAWWEGCTTQIWELDFSLDYADTVTSHLLRAWGLD